MCGTTGPLIISVAEPEQGNRLIDAGLVRHHENCVVARCFKCYHYGHVAKVCQNLPRCGRCAARGHVTNDCLGKDSWARECPERAKRPTHFQSLPQLQAQLQLRLQLQLQLQSPITAVINHLQLRTSSGLRSRLVDVRQAHHLGLYGGTTHKYCYNREGSERHTRFQHFITFAMHNQKTSFKR